MCKAFLTTVWILAFTLEGSELRRHEVGRSEAQVLRLTGGPEVRV